MFSYFRSAPKKTALATPEAQHFTKDAQTILNALSAFKANHCTTDKIRPLDKRWTPNVLADMECLEKSYHKIITQGSVLALSDDEMKYELKRELYFDHRTVKDEFLCGEYHTEIKPKYQKVVDEIQKAYSPIQALIEKFYQNYVNLPTIRKINQNLWSFHTLCVYALGILQVITYEKSIPETLKNQALHLLAQIRSDHKLVDRKSLLSFTSEQILEFNAIPNNLQQTLKLAESCQAFVNFKDTPEMINIETKLPEMQNITYESLLQLDALSENLEKEWEIPDPIEKDWIPVSAKK